MTEVLIGAYYNHYKNKPYKVLDVAKGSEDMTDYVVYQALYENETAKTWIRPYKMFVEVVNGKARFELLPPKQWPKPFDQFHAHIYFNEQSQAQAEVFHHKMQENKEYTAVSPLRFELRGPHPHWMFTVNFASENFMPMIEFMQKHRDGLSILIHPLSGNEVLDHTDYAMFLGQKENLNLAVLT
jgi:aromatic ring-cleaving dioxygenase